MSNLPIPQIPVGALSSLTLAKLLPAILVLMICLICKKFAMRLIDRMLSLSRIEKSLHSFVRSCANISLIVAIVMIILDMLGIPITTFVAVVSVAGLAISLALQGVLGNVANGVMLLLTKPFLVGDYVNIGEISGTVEEIGLVYTKFLTFDNKAIFAPNSEIASGKIINNTAQGSRRIEIIITAAYESPIADVKAALRAAMARHAVILETPKPFVNVVEYKDSSIAYALRCWVENEHYWDTYYALLEDIHEEFELHHVEMAYPHLNVHMIEDKAAVSVGSARD